MQTKSQIIKIDSEGVRSNDRFGPYYYRGRPMASVHGTAMLFDAARRFWSMQKINDMDVELTGIDVITAQNGLTLRNVYNDRNIVPCEDPAQKNNRTSWYNAHFVIGGMPIDTGWVCHTAYRTQYMASTIAASEVVANFGRPAFAKNFINRLLCTCIERANNR